MLTLKQLLPWVGATLVWASVSGYWLYTLAGVSILRDVLLRGRRVLVTLGLALSVPWSLEYHAVLALSLSLVGAFYSYRRQWLMPASAVLLEPSSLKLEPPEWGVWLVDRGVFVPLRWAARLRTLRVRLDGEALIISYCGLADSLRVFRDVGGEMAAVLPHGTGFYVGDTSRYWDGNTGNLAYGDGTNLESHPFVLCESQSASDAIVFTPFGKPVLPVPLKRHPVVPGARGVTRGMDRGVVVDGAWRPIGSSSGECEWCLSRWAALASGLPLSD